MSWLRLDDRMVGHRKTRRLLKGHRAGAGLASFGLHTLAMLHASEYLTDGFVEQEFIDETLDDAKVRGKARVELVDALVAGGQWEPADGGYVIHDFLEHNPTRADVEIQRGVDRFRKELTRDHALIAAIRDRDGDACRYCGVTVNWKDRRSNVGGTYDHVTPVSKGGQNTFDNVVVCCRGCNQKKGPRTPEQAAMYLTGSTPGSSRDLDPVSDSRPVPSRPTPELPPDPPAGGRKRDREPFEEEMRVWCRSILDRFPDLSTILPDDGAPERHVRLATDRLRLARMDATPELVRDRLVAQYDTKAAA